MYCAWGVFIKIRLIPCCAVSYPYFSSIFHCHIDNNAKVLGFWRVAKEQNLLTLFKEDYK